MSLLTPEEQELPHVDGKEQRINGAADIFVIFEPLAGKRETIVMESKTA